MSGKLTNDNIDKIFRNSIDDMETQPSENFWINASEDALFKSNLANSRSISNWKLVAASLAAALVFLSVYLIYTQKQLSNINQKLVAVENKNSNQNKDITSIPNNTSIVSVSANQEKSQPKAEQKEHSTKKYKVTVAKAKYAVQNPVYVKKKLAKTINKNAVAFNTTGSFHSAQNGYIAKKKKRIAKSSPVSIASNIPVQKAANSNKENGGQNKPDVQVNNVSSTDNLIAITNPDKVSIPVNNSQISYALADNIEPIQNEIKGTERKSILDKMTLSLFCQPYLSDERFENDATDIVIKNNVSSYEEEVSPFSVGAKVGYEISKHWSLTSGLLYYKFNISVSPATIFAQQQKTGDVGYSFQTSMGTVSCPNGNTNPTVGDYMVVSGKETAEYISIPLQFKYNFITSGKLGLYLTAGSMVNIVVYRAMTMHWQDYTSNDGDATEGIDNSKKVYTSFYIAPGISYRLFNACSVFAEPSLQGSPIFSSARNAPPYIGMGGGITWSL